MDKLLNIIVATLCLGTLPLTGIMLYSFITHKDINFSSRLYKVRMKYSK